MGNKFGNYPSVEAAETALEADGFAKNERGYFTQASRTGGNLFDEPRDCVAIVEITSYRVDGQYAPDGADYYVFQHHFI